MLGTPIAVYYQLVATEYGSFRSSSCHSTDGNAVASTCIFYEVAQGLAAMDQPSMDGFNTYIVARAVREQGIIVALRRG
jgi:hypothetical protein